MSRDFNYLCLKTIISLYNLIIYLTAGLMRIAALFNPKAKLFVNGRKKLFQALSSQFKNNNAPVAWFHCASLGEFEQGRPVIEKLKAEFPEFRILLTFFSPSGFELRKNYEQADWVFYLPWDTLSNAKAFIRITQPKIAFFVKYEFWHNYAAQLHKLKIPLLSFSTIFRRDQVFFKSYGSFFRSTLNQFNFFFVQNQESQNLLHSIGIKNCDIAGDTRFDRVQQIIDAAKEIPIAKDFKGSQNAFVIGSCWSEDLEVLAPFINDQEGKLKFIIAPHEISESFLQEIETSIVSKSIRYSRATGDLNSYSVLIIDNIGLLSRLYRYGEFAYVGGGFGKGLHNILEAACYGVPIFFGDKNFQKFNEAQELIMRGGAFEISGYSDLKHKYEQMINRPENFLLACEVTRSYVSENLGATKKIISYCHQLLDIKFFDAKA